MKVFCIKIKLTNFNYLYPYFQLLKDKITLNELF